MKAEHGIKAIPEQVQLKLEYGQWIEWIRWKTRVGKMFTAGLKAERRRYCQVLKEVAAAGLWSQGRGGERWPRGVSDGGLSESGESTWIRKEGAHQRHFKQGRAIMRSGAQKEYFGCSLKSGMRRQNGEQRNKIQMTAVTMKDCGQRTAKPWGSAEYSGIQPKL